MTSEPPVLTVPLALPRRIALVAHDGKKPELIDWARHNRRILQNTRIVATSTTGKILEKELEMPIEKLLSGPLGGDQQLGAMIAEHKIDLLVFFWDPLSSQPHDPDVKALLRLTQVWNVPVASNRATADYLISSPLFRENYKHAVPNYETHNERKI